MRKSRTIVCSVVSLLVLVCATLIWKIGSSATAADTSTLDIAGAHQSMLQFSVCDRVRFDTPDGRWISGILTRYNEKTVTVLAEDAGLLLRSASMEYRSAVRCTGNSEKGPELLPPAAAD